MMFPFPPAIFALTVMLAQAAPPPLVTPASAKTYAQILLREGTTLFERGETASALRKFEQAYAVFPSPKIWFNVGAAERVLDQPVEALSAFQRFLAEAPQAPAASRLEAEQAVAALTSSLGRLNVACAVTGVDVSIDGKPAGVTPLTAPIWATPGQHQLAGQHEGMAPDVQDVTVVAGTERTVILGVHAVETASAAPPPLPAPVPVVEAPPAPTLLAPVQPRPASPIPAPVTTATTPGERPVTRRWWFWTAVGAVVAAGVVGVILATRGGGTDVPGTTLGSQGFP